MNEDELEAILRRGLSAHAEDAEDPGGRADAARAGVRRRRRLQGAAAGLAAVVVLGPIAVVATTGSDGKPTDKQPTAAEGPTGWRAESYNGIQLRVPASWGWGTTPALRGDGVMTECPDRAFSDATSFEDVRPPRGGVALEPYVGRPLPSGDPCSEILVTQAAHVWFDSPLPVDEDPVGGVTVPVKGLTMLNVTVFDPNLARQQAILDTIHGVATDANGCGTRPPDQAYGETPPDPDSLTSISVCVYYAHENPPGGMFGKNAVYLYYSTAISDEAAAVAHAIDDGDGGSGIETGDLCVPSTPRSIDLVEHGDEDRSYTYSVNPDDCAGHNLGYWGQPDFHLLTKQSVWLWAVDGTALYSKGGSHGNRLAPFLPPS